MTGKGPGRASESVTASPDQPVRRGLAGTGGSLLRLARLILRPCMVAGTTFRVRAFPDLESGLGPRHRLTCPPSAGKAIEARVRLPWNLQLLGATMFWLFSFLPRPPIAPWKLRPLVLHCCPMSFVSSNYKLNNVVDNLLSKWARLQFL